MVIMYSMFTLHVYLRPHIERVILQTVGEEAHVHLSACMLIYFYKCIHMHVYTALQ